MKIYFVDRVRMCSYAGKSKRKLKECKRKSTHTFRGNRVCDFHGQKLSTWNREGKI